MMVPRAEIGLLAGVAAVFAVAVVSLNVRTPSPPPIVKTREVGGGLVAVVSPPPVVVPSSQAEAMARSWWRERAELAGNPKPLPPSVLGSLVRRIWNHGRDGLQAHWRSVESTASRLRSRSVRLAGGIAEIPPDAKGMTWGKRYRDERLEIDMVGCWAGESCGPVRGDTPCESSRPLLCVKIDGRTRPPYQVRDPEHGDDAIFGGWLGGEMAITPPTAGTRLRSREIADGICREALGDGWRMAENEDGRYIEGMDSTHAWGESWDAQTAEIGAFSFYAHGKVPTNGRFWVANNDKKANCWDSW